MANSNYTTILKDRLYDCIKTCEQTLGIAKKFHSVEQPDLVNNVRKELVDTCQACIENCKRCAESAAIYLQHAVETDSRARVKKAVEHMNICIANCNHIISSCDNLNNKCADMIQSCVNTIQECIEACRLAAQHPEL